MTDPMQNHRDALGIAASILRKDGYQANERGQQCLAEAYEDLVRRFHARREEHMFIDRLPMPYPRSQPG